MKLKPNSPVNLVLFLVPFMVFPYFVFMAVAMSPLFISKYEGNDMPVFLGYLILTAICVIACIAVGKKTKWLQTIFQPNT